MKTGFFKAKVIEINPDFNWLEKNFSEVEKPEYTFEKKGIECAKIDIYLESPQEDIFKHTILLENEEVLYRTGSYQYVNCLGQTQIAQSESQLWDSFLHFEKVVSWELNGNKFSNYKPGAKPKEKEIIGKKQYHIAKKGEVDLLHFIKMLTNPNLYDETTNLFIDLNKLFKGDFSTLKNMLGEEKDFHFVAFAYVDKKMQQKIYKRFLKLDFYRDVVNNMTISSFNKKQYEEWLKEFEYDCEECNYELGKIQNFKQEHIKTKKEITDDGDDY